MRIKKINFMILFMIVLSLFNCSTQPNTISVETKKDYTGWCFIIPTSDNTTYHSNKINGKYLFNEDGIVYVPKKLINLKKDNIVKIYETLTNNDITDLAKYTSNVTYTDKEGTQYSYIHFYLPSSKERSSANDSQYWREKRYEYSLLESNQFENLLRQKKIGSVSE